MGCNGFGAAVLTQIATEIVPVMVESPWGHKGESRTLWLKQIFGIDTVLSQNKHSFQICDVLEKSLHIFGDFLCISYFGISC